MDIRKLQRAIVDGLEDVKAQDIVVFNTEHLSPLFERVIIASGTSNRQTKALAASVRDAVKTAGMPVLSTEGGENGEWIIVDCGAAVAHVMQPSFRDYYRLEEIWGGKPVKMKLGDGPKGLVKAADQDDDEDDVPQPNKAVAKKASAKQAPAKQAPAKKAAAKKVAAPPAAAKKPAAKTDARRSARSAPVRATTKSATPSASAKRAAPAKKAASAKSTAPARSAPIKTLVVNAPVKKAKPGPATKRPGTRRTPSRG
ncbi:MAG: ribosome silencing factor [Ideonella sp.]|nr:ribosome silencing factor [Ideonella sp.]